MQPFTTFRSIGVPIDIANCDTDQIIPARFMSRLPGESGYERYLLHDLRFDAEGREREFILNRPPYRDGKVLVADVNWGCGSSREQAVHALLANGIRVVIAPSFGDIHYSNCMKHGLLPVRLPRSVCARMRAELHARPGAEIAVELEAQMVTGPEGESHRFEIDPFDKTRMLKGLDDISLTREYEAEIDAFERRHRAVYEWI